MAECQNPVPLVNIKIAGKWMFIPLKMVLIGIDPFPYRSLSCAVSHGFQGQHLFCFLCFPWWDPLRTKSPESHSQKHDCAALRPYDVPMVNPGSGQKSAKTRKIDLIWLGCYMEGCWLNELYDDHWFVMVKHGQTTWTFVVAHLQEIKVAPEISQDSLLKRKGFPVSQFFNMDSQLTTVLHNSREHGRGRLGSKMFQKHSWFETKSESAAACHLFSAPHLHGLQCLSLKNDSRHLFHQNMLCKYIIVYSIFWIVLDLRDIFLSRPGPAIFAIFASGCRGFHGVDCTNESDGLRFRRNCLQRFVLVSSLQMFGLAGVLLCRVLRTQCISCEHACLMHETDW